MRFDAPSPTLAFFGCLSVTPPFSKNWLLIPARLALSLCKQGWILRAEVIWDKGAGRPESARDRPTEATKPSFFSASRGRTGMMDRPSRSRWFHHHTHHEIGHAMEQSVGKQRRMCFASGEMPMAAMRDPSGVFRLAPTLVRIPPPSQPSLSDVVWRHRVHPADGFSILSAALVHLLWSPSSLACKRR